MTSVQMKSPRPRGTLWAVLVSTAALALACGCEERAAIEPSKPAVTPVKTGPDEPGTVTLHLPPEILDVYRALAWTEQEKTILAAAVDYNRQWREPPFFTAMQRVRKISPLPNKVFNVLDCPSYSSLMLEPKRYRGRPIRLTANIVEVEKAKPGKDFTLSRRWTRDDGPIWRIIALNNRAEYPGDEPIQIFCTFDPISRLNLGRPTETIDGRARYAFRSKNARKIEVAGVFYKVFREEDWGGRQRTAKMTDYPIVLAWQISRADPGLEKSSVDPRVIGLFVGVLALAGIYMILRRWVKRSEAGRGPRRTYRPLRTMQTTEDPVRGAPAAQDSTADEIDPLLKAASKQYRKEKGLDDEEDRHGRTGAT